MTKLYMLKTDFFALRGVTWVMIAAMGMSSFACSRENMDTYQEVRSQLRWQYDKPEIRERDEIEGLIVDGSEGARARAEQLLLRNVQSFAGDPLEAITRNGISPDESGKKILAVRDLAYDYALLWMLTGEQEYAGKSKAILFRLVEVIPHWPLYDRQGKPQAQDRVQYLRHAEANGLWGRWHPLDLARALPLLRAYDILRPSLSEQEREDLETGLLIYHKELISRFTGLAPLYHNLSGYHLIPLIQFGWVLERPDYVHEAIEYWDEMLRYSYGADGFYREITPDYHNQISWRLTTAIPEMLKGYSDPEGYVHPLTGKRYDHLNLLEADAPRLERVKGAVRVLLMPDGSYANLNDSWPKQSPRERQPSSEPGLLGTSGVAKLGTPGMVAFLKYHGIRGHDHRDALGLVWFSGGKEVFSDTGYHSGRDEALDFERFWSASTASHMTVAVDEQNHFTSRETVIVPAPAPRSGFASNPPEVSGEHPLEASLPAAARFTNQGSLRIWNPTQKTVQAMEADQENAYPGLLSLFRRSLIMVPLDPESGVGYLVDLFRIRGGNTHDYFLRGGLDHPYTLQADVEMESTDDIVYQYIQLEGKGEVTEGLNVQARYEDGLTVVSRFVGVASEEAPFQLLQGKGKAIRRPGDADILILRNQGGETLFPWIHETTSGESRIKEVQVWQEGMQVVLTIHLGDRIDVIFSAEDEQSKFEFEGWEFRGRLAYGTFTGNAEEMEWNVFDGVELAYQGKPVEPLFTAVRAKLLETTSVDAGDDQNSLLIENHQDLQLQRDYHVAHVDFGQGVRQSYPIQEILREEGKLRVILDYIPGFTVGEGYSAMTQYPSWRIQGEPVVELQ